MSLVNFWRRVQAPDDDDPTELAALADGSLPPQRRATVEGRVAKSPELAARLAEQQHSLALVRGATGSVTAPATLRARVEAEPRSRSRLPGRRLVLGSGLVAAAAVALVVVPFVRLGGGTPSVAAAAGLSTRRAIGPAPAAQRGRPLLLAKTVGGVSFPNWQTRFGWRATGSRTDDLSGRRTATVFYEKTGRGLAYTIVDGSPLAVPGGAELAVRGATDLHSFVAHDRLVVTWRRGGHTCVLSGPGVERSILLKLAAWNANGSIPS
jgi:anti-sigma factor RsiW